MSNNSIEIAPQPHHYVGPAPLEVIIGVAAPEEH
jgi:hypothetical protein